jgi:NhaP-type Na+/H+ or K+/H+ antiporter
LNLFNPYDWGGKDNEKVTNEISLEVTRVVIALSVFAVGVELPKVPLLLSKPRFHADIQEYVWRHWRTLVFLLGPCMVWGWMVTALLIWGLLPGHNFLSSLVIAACVTPTDPILAQAVIGGKFAEKHVPAHVRHMLAAESGCNDGAAFPFLYIAIYLLLDASPGHAVGEWIYHSM